jgi:hypothetical protein
MASPSVCQSDVTECGAGLRYEGVERVLIDRQGRKRMQRWVPHLCGIAPIKFAMSVRRV